MVANYKNFYMNEIAVVDKILIVEDDWMKKTFIVKSNKKKATIEVKYKHHLTSNLVYEIFIGCKEENAFSAVFIEMNHDLEMFELYLIALKSCYTFLKTGAITIENENINNTPQ